MDACELNHYELRALKAISNNFWQRRITFASKQEMYLWLEGIPNSRVILGDLIRRGYLVEGSRVLSGTSVSYHVSLSRDGHRIVQTYGHRHQSSLVRGIPLNSPLRRQMTKRNVRHLLQIADSIVGAGALTVERLRFAHESFGVRKDLTSLDQHEAKMSVNYLDGRIHLFLSAAVEMGFLARSEQDGQFQKTRNGISLVHENEHAVELS